MSSDTIITVSGLTKEYHIYSRPEDRLKQAFSRMLGLDKQFCSTYRALHDVSFKIRKGETTGVVGANGAGKTTLLRCIVGNLAPTRGKLQTSGRISAIMALGTGFNNNFTGLENIRHQAALLGMSRGEIRGKIDEIIAFADIGDHIRLPIKGYSSGMVARLGFATAISLDPDILIVDEALAVGDEAFVRKCFARLEDLKKAGVTIFFVSHASQTVIELCDRALLLHHGELLMDGRPDIVIRNYHRLILAPREKQDAIVAAMRDPASAEAKEEEKAAGKPAEPPAGLQPFFDPGLQSKSIFAYTQNGAVISNLRVQDNAGTQLNVLPSRGEYHFCYDLRVERDFPFLRAGMLLKTKSGLELFACTRPAMALKQGEEITLRFVIVFNLIPSVYFFNAGVFFKQDGQMVYAHRIIDGLMVRIIAPKSAFLLNGIVDLRASVSVEED